MMLTTSLNEPFVRTNRGYVMDFNYVMETLDLRFQTMSNENCGRL